MCGSSRCVATPMGGGRKSKRSRWRPPMPPARLLNREHSAGKPRFTSGATHITLVKAKWCFSQKPTHHVEIKVHQAAGPIDLASHDLGPGRQLADALQQRNARQRGAGQLRALRRYGARAQAESRNGSQQPLWHEDACRTTRAPALALATGAARAALAASRLLALAGAGLLAAAAAAACWLAATAGGAGTTPCIVAARAGATPTLALLASHVWLGCRAARADLGRPGAPGCCLDSTPTEQPLEQPISSPRRDRGALMTPAQRRSTGAPAP